MNAERSGGTGMWAGIGAFVCATLAISSWLVAEANPSTAVLKDRLATSTLRPPGFGAQPGKVRAERVDDHESVTFNYRGDWFGARLRFEIYDEGSTARDAYLGHREGDRSAAVSSRRRVNQGSIPPRRGAPGDDLTFPR